MYQMLRHPAPRAQIFMIYQETHTATMTCGSKGYILLLRTMLCFDKCRAWTVLVQTYKNISGEGVELPYLPLNTAWYELIATRDERHDKIQNFRFLSQVLIRII